jgi:ribosomal protein S6
MISPDEAGQAWERIKGFITNREAEIVHEERWGTRRLAYPVKKGQYQFLEGNYHLTRFATEQSFNRELENYLKLDDQVLRSLVTATLTEEELAAHAAQTRAPRPPRPPAGAPPAGGPAPGAAAPTPTAPPAVAPPAAEGASAPSSDAPATPAAEATPAETSTESPVPEAAPPVEPQPEQPS